MNRKESRRVAETVSILLGRRPNGAGTSKLAADLSREPELSPDPFDGGCPADTEPRVVVRSSAVADFRKAKGMGKDTN